VVRVTPPNLMLWLTGYVRARAAAESISVAVGNKEPPKLTLPLAKPLILLRDDSGPRLSQVTFDRSIGASVLDGSKLNDTPAEELSLWLAGVLFDKGIALVDGSPIASVEFDGCNGPYPVTESLDVARRYLVAQYTVVGTW
jgi:hypothetical protein